MGERNERNRENFKVLIDGALSRQKYRSRFVCVFTPVAFSLPNGRYGFVGSRESQ